MPIQFYFCASYWHYQGDEFCYLFCRPRIPSSLPFLWSCICFTPLKQSGELSIRVGLNNNCTHARAYVTSSRVRYCCLLYIGVCLATLVMCPTPEAAVQQLITGHLCALREHITMRTFKVYSRYPPQVNQKQGVNQTESVGPGKPAATQQQRVRQGKEGGRKGSRTRELTVQQVGPASSKELTVSGASEPVTVEERFDTPPPNDAPSLTVPEATPPQTPEQILNTQYFNMVEAKTSELMTMAREGVQEGWLEVGMTKNVHVMKKLPEENEPPINSVKGSGAVAAPPEFLVRVLEDPANVTILDDLLKETRALERLSPAVTLVHLLYKAVWPTSPRDFSILSICGRVNDTTWISLGTSVVDDRMPPEKGYVRADLLIGGYVLHSVPDNPDMSNVTYAACVNMKGTIPAFAVNKVAESQPQCINHLRKLAEPLYRKMRADPAALIAFEEKFPISPVFPPKQEQPPDVEPAPASGADTRELSGRDSLGQPLAANSSPVSHEDSLEPVGPDNTSLDEPDAPAQPTAHPDLLGPATAPTSQPVLSSSPVVLEDRLAHTQWHFDPSAEPLTNGPSHLHSTQENGFEASVEGHFKTPPISSDEEELAEPLPMVNGTVPVAEPATPTSLSTTSLSTTEGTAPSAALQLSQYVPDPANIEVGIHSGNNTCTQLYRCLLQDSPFQSITKENIYYPSKQCTL